jgi:peptidoglycan hydrolase-like protein with peptidoglycan-binding domain
MAVGNYGTVRAADVSVDDIEIFYTKNDGNSISNLIKFPDPSAVLVKVDNPDPENQGEIFGGLYTLRLPTSIFNSKGIYTIIIRPKQHRLKISDCAVLAANNDVVGVVIDKGDADFPTKLSADGSLVGYRIEYISTDPNAAEKKIPNLFRIITSDNRAAAVSDQTNSSAKNNSYAFSTSSNLTFCTLTPSSAPSVRPNALPYIGEPEQEIIVSNTYFNPIMLEVEMVEHDDETLAYALYGNQTKSLEDGIYSIYNFENAIYRQYNLYEVKDQFTGSPLYEVRQERDAIDFTKDFDSITDF